MEVTGVIPVPVKYQNVLIKASQYSDMVHMSKQGIYDRLVSEYGGDIHLRGSAVRHRTLPERHPVNMSKLGKWSD